MNIEELKKHSINIRRNIIKMVSSAKSGHPGGSLSATDILTVLFFEKMNINKENANSNKRDRFVLSKGHASPVLYATLFEKGIINEDLSTFRQLNSNLQGHPSMHKLPGIDMSTGSLGQGISTAVGMAIANKLDNNDHKVYVLIGDGESQEGLVWEALMAASHFKLNNLCIILDFNHLQIDGEIEKVMNPTPFDEKFRAFGLNVKIIDGHNYEEISETFDEFINNNLDKPTIIIANTIKGKGVSFMENKYEWHGSSPNEEETKLALSELCLKENS